MVVLNKDELKQINGGSVTGTFINAVVKGINSFLDLGRAVGSGIRRIGSGNICPL